MFLLELQMGRSRKYSLVVLKVIGIMFVRIFRLGNSQFLKIL